LEFLLITCLLAENLVYYLSTIRFVSISSFTDAIHIVIPVVATFAPSVPFLAQTYVKEVTKALMLSIPNGYELAMERSS
jgi:hypothetical protein